MAVILAMGRLKILNRVGRSKAGIAIVPKVYHRSITEEIQIANATPITKTTTMANLITF